MGSWFSKMFIGSAVVGSLSLPAAQAANNTGQNAKIDPVETPTSIKQDHSQIRIFKNIIPIDMDTELPGSWSGGGHNQEKRAYYDHAHKRVVCQCYSISDNTAYLRAQHQTGKAPRADFSTALKEFNQMLQAVEYKGPMPKTLEEVEKILSSSDNALNKKKMQNVSNVAQETGLDAAINLTKSIKNINEENTSQHVIVHEIEHGQTAKTKEKAILPSALLSPQDYFLFTMADELNSFCKEGELAAKTPQQVIGEFRQIHEGAYIERNAAAISDNNSYWNSETYKHSFAQNLDIKGSQQITHTSPIVFGENFNAEINGQQYPVSKCIREADQSWCYTVMEDGERQQLPTGTVLTAPNGKKYEANTLYDKSGKPVLDQDGHKSGGFGYWDEDNGWSIKIGTYQRQAEDNFSKANFEKLMTEKFGERSPENELRTLIEAEFDRYRQTNSYKSLTGIIPAQSIDPAYVAECKATPVTDDYVRTGSQYRAKLTDNTENMVDITDNYTKRGVINNHLSYARENISGREGASNTQTAELSQSRGDYNQFIDTYNQLKKQRD